MNLVTHCHNIVRCLLQGENLTMFRRWSNPSIKHIAYIAAFTCMTFMLVQEIALAEYQHETTPLIGQWKYTVANCHTPQGEWFDTLDDAIDHYVNWFHFDYRNHCSWELDRMDPWATPGEPIRGSCATVHWYPKFFPVCHLYESYDYPDGIECQNSRMFYTEWVGFTQGDDPCSQMGETGFWGYRSRTVECPKGFIWDHGKGLCIRSDTQDDPFKHNEPDCPSNGTNPINASQGYKIQRELDYSDAHGRLTLSRHYSSNHHLGTTAIGRNWRHNWDRRIELNVVHNNQTIVVFRENHNRYYFTSKDSGLTWISEPDVPMTLETTSDPSQANAAWIITLNDRIREWYDGEGRLIKIDHGDGSKLYFEYTDNDLVKVSDQHGRSLEFLYSEAGRLTSVLTPSELTVHFHYNNDDMLTAVSYDAGENTPPSRRYFYENATYPYLLTGIEDELENRIASWAYNSSRRAVLSTQGDIESPIGRHQISYSATGSGLVVSASIIDPVGYQRNYSFGLRGQQGKRRILQVSHPCPSCGGNTHKFEYDSNGWLTEKIDFNGIKTLYQYDDLGLETQRTEAPGQPEERIIEMDWHPGWRLPLEERRPGLTVSFQYDVAGQLTSRTEQDTITEQIRTTTYQYHNSSHPVLDGLLHSITDSGGNVTHYEYYTSDAADNRYLMRDVKTITNPLGHVTEFLEYDPAGRPLRIRDPNGVDTVMTYHVRGWLLTQTVAGATTSYNYLPNGLVSRITQPDGSYLDFEYDGAHRLEAIENALGERIEYELDAAGNRTAERIYDDQSTLSFELQQVYDQLGRLETTLTGTGHETGYEYDAAGNLTDVTDALDNTTGHEYDPLNRLKKTLDALGGETSFAYDARDNLVEVTDPEGLSTHYTYNAFDELVELDSPDTGVTTYTYDSAGNRLTQTDARGVTTTYSYDALNRPTAVQYPDNSLDVAYFYDEGDGVTGCTGSYPIGRLTRMTDPSGTTVYCYDARGNVTHKQLPGLDVEISYEYNAADRLTAITYPSGRKVTYSRDTAGQITSMMLMTAPFIGDPLVTNAHYLPFGPVAGYTLGNGQALQRAHNLDHQITDVTSPALELHFRRDPAGNIDRLGTAPGAATPLEEYAYDDLYRLEAVQDELGIDIEAYAYDLIGNRQSKTTTAGTELYDYATGSHRLIEVDSKIRSYDTVGNLLSDQAGSRTYTYGDHNRLTAFSDTGDNASYQYNGRGERAYKAVQSSGGGTTQSFSITNSTYFFYDEAGRLLAEHSAGMLGPIDTFREYAYLDDIPVALVEPNGDAYHLHADHLGTPRAVTDGNATKRWEWAFESNPFGELLPDEDPDKTGKSFTLNLRFPGQYYDAESGLHYNYFREYEPGVGRYAQSDLIGLSGGYNTYAYVYSNPMVWTDSYGLSARDRGAIIGCAIGGGIGSYYGAVAGGAGGGTLGLACGPGSAGCSIAGAAAGGSLGYATGFAGGCTAGGLLGGAVGVIIDWCTDDDDEDDECEALYQSILATCAGLTGRLRFRCFEAARIARDQCYQERRR